MKLWWLFFAPSSPMNLRENLACWFWQKSSCLLNTDLYWCKIAKHPENCFIAASCPRFGARVRELPMHRRSEFFWQGFGLSSAPVLLLTSSRIHLLCFESCPSALCMFSELSTQRSEASRITVPLKLSLKVVVFEDGFHAGICSKRAESQTD